jgi:hypothetical protein
VLLLAKAPKVSNKHMTGAFQTSISCLCLGAAVLLLMNILKVSDKHIHTYIHDRSFLHQHRAIALEAVVLLLVKTLSLVPDIY